MDKAIKYKVNIGENGNKFGVRKLDVNLIIAEYWSDKGRAFGINIAGKDVVLRFVGPKKNQAIIATFKNNKISQGKQAWKYISYAWVMKEVAPYIWDWRHTPQGQIHGQLTSKTN